MALIIAIVLIVVLFGRVSYDKLALKAIQVDRRNKDALRARYTNECLEEKIDMLLKDSQGFKKLRAEQELAFKQAKSDDPTIEWRDIPDIKTVILANRGFVTDNSWVWGYEENPSRTYYRSYYNSVNWIYQTLKKQGIDLEPFYIITPGYDTDNAYVWAGSLADDSWSRRRGAKKYKFDRSWLDPPPVTLPPPYYENKQE